MTARDDVDRLHRLTLAQLDALRRECSEDRDALAQDEPVPESILEEERRIVATELAGLWSAITALADRVDSGSR